MKKDDHEIVQCKECVHRPVIELNKDLSVQLIKPPKIEDIYDDFTCPFLCDDAYYNSMPKDDFFCAYGERRSNETR